MSRLNETSKWWQWNDGPIFPGPEGRELALECGRKVMRKVMRKEIEEELEHLQEVRRVLLLHLDLLDLLEKRQKGETGLDKQPSAR